MECKFDYKFVCPPGGLNIGQNFGLEDIYDVSSFKPTNTFFFG